MKNKNFVCTVLFFSSFLLCAHSVAADLKIGITTALSGAYAHYGRHALQGAQLAVEEVNGRGGVGGRRVQLLVEDEGTLDLKAALTAARKLVEVDKVEVLLPLIIEDSEVIVPFTSKKPLFTMAVGCGARRCSSNVGPFHVRAPSSHDEIISRLMAYVKKSGPKHICIMAAESTYFEEYGRYIEELSRSNGYKVTYAGVPTSNTNDYRDIAVRFAHSQCDAVFAWVPMGAVGGFFRRAREVGMKSQMLSIVETDDPGVLKTAGAAANGVVFARFALGSEAFQARYQKRFSEIPSRPAVPSYDGVKLLLQLIEKVGTGPEKLKAAFGEVSNLSAENGYLSYTSEGERRGEAVELMQIVDGAPALLSQ